MLKFAPLCLDNIQPRAYVNSGHILPCCYMDYTFRYKKEELPKVFQDLLDDELNIKNADSLESIMSSNQWQTFLGYMKDAKNGKIECNVLECNKYCTKNFNNDPTAKRVNV